MDVQDGARFGNPGPLGKIYIFRFFKFGPTPSRSMSQGQKTSNTSSSNLKILRLDSTDLGVNSWGQRSGHPIKRLVGPNPCVGVIGGVVKCQNSTFNVAKNSPTP